MKTRTLERVRLGDNRELRISRVDNGYQDLIRIDSFLRDTDTAYSGVVFPAVDLTKVMEALTRVEARG